MARRSASRTKIQVAYDYLRQKFGMRESLSIISVTENVPLQDVCETLGHDFHKLFGGSPEPQYKYE